MRARSSRRSRKAAMASSFSGRSKQPLSTFKHGSPTPPITSPRNRAATRSNRAPTKWPAFASKTRCSGAATTRKSPASKADPKTRRAIWPSMATFAYRQAKRSSPPARCSISIASCGASPSRFSCWNPISRLLPTPLPMPFTCARISWCATPRSSPCACFAAIWDGTETPPKLPTRFCAWKAATWPRIGFCSATEAP